jgi:hypothetical protein
MLPAKGCETADYYSWPPEGTFPLRPNRPLPTRHFGNIKVRGGMMDNKAAKAGALLASKR